MSILIQDGDFTAAQAQGAKRWFYPFEADSSSRYFEQDYTQFDADRVPLNMDSQHPDLPDFYLVEETDPQPLGGGVVQWSRRYAQIPQSRRDYESFSFTFPGLSTVASAQIHSINSGASAVGVTTLTCASPPGVAAGDSIIVRYRVADANVPTISYARMAIRTVVSVSGSDVVVAVISEPQPIVAWSYLVAYDPGRDPITYTVGSFIQRDYFLPGVSSGINDPLDVPILAPDLILDNEGKQTDTYGTDTVPDRDSYKDKMQAGEWIIAEHSAIARWMGNIYERRTRYVRAI